LENSTWTSDAFYLLARSTGGHVHDVQQCRLGVSPTLRRWRALDSWGQVVGEVRGVDTDRHHFEVVWGTRGVGVYTTANTSYRSAEWRPSEAERRSFDSWLARRLMNATAVFFRGQGSYRHSRFAFATAPDGLMVAQRSDAAWRVAHQESHEADWPVFQPRVIVDMNTDGVPEIIYHFSEYDDGVGHEVVLTSSDAGHSWRAAADNQDRCP
jgi:hypothetical protein